MLPVKKAGLHQRIRPYQYNKLVERLNILSHISGGSGIDVSVSSLGVHIGSSGSPAGTIFATITVSLSYSGNDDVSAYTAVLDSGEEITISGLLQDGDHISADLRFWFPWFLVDDVVAVVKVGAEWFLFSPLIPRGAEGTCSLRWNESGKRVMAVFR